MVVKLFLRLLQKAFPVLLTSWEQGAGCTEQRDAGCELEEREFCSIHGIVNEPLDPQDTSGTRHKQKRTLGGFLGEWFRSHPLLTLLVLILLLLLVLALGVALAVQSGSCGGAPVTPVTAVTPVLLGCPSAWVGYGGVCYFLSRDEGSWDQGQAQCSELGASLAVLKEEEMEFLSRLSGNVDYWLGLRRRGQGLQWVDGSSFNSSFPVAGTAECVYLADSKLRSGTCSNLRPYLCSRAQTPL